MDRGYSAAQVIALSVALIASGCTGLLRTEPFVDSRTDTNGAVILLDTPRMWEYWQQDVERAIEKELAGKSPGGGVLTWNDQWARVIDANRTCENSQRYIDYIIQSRRSVGLPDLVTVGGPGGA